MAESKLPELHKRSAYDDTNQARSIEKNGVPGIPLIR